jgi:putative addiction module component (TIGR02574 family)
MAPAVEQWKPQLEKLPPEDRAELALFLLQSLEPEDEDVQAAWDAEVARRVTEIRNGTAKGRPAEEVFAELRARF